MTRTMITAAVATLALITVAPAARAQDPALPPYDYSNYDVLLDTLGNPYRPADGNGADKPNAPKKRVKRPTRRQLGTLRFQPTPEVTQRVYRLAIEKLWPGFDPVLLTGQLDAAKAQYRTVLGRLGWSTSNLGDMAAFGLVQGYLNWHQVTSAPAAGLRVLRREVRHGLARQKRVRRLSDARQQEFAETLELRVIFFLDAYNDARTLGDSAAVAIARADMREWTEQTFGIDVNYVRLTRRGLVER